MPPEGATKDPSFILGFLEGALCNLVDMGMSLMKLQPMHLLRPSLPPFYIDAESLCRVPSFVA